MQNERESQTNAPLQRVYGTGKTGQKAIQRAVGKALIVPTK